MSFVTINQRQLIWRMILGCGQWVTELSLQHGRLLGSETQRCPIHVSWKKHHHVSNGMGALTSKVYADFGPCAFDNSGISFVHEEFAINRWSKKMKRRADTVTVMENNLFFFCLITEETRLQHRTHPAREIVDETRLLHWQAHMLDEWRLSAVKLCDDGWHAWNTAGVTVSMTGIQLVSTAVLFHDVGKCCLITTLKTAQLC